MTETRRTYEDVLIEARQSAEGLFTCPAGCGRSVRAFEIAEAPDFGNLPDMACSHCILEANRLALAAAEEEAVATLAPWDTESGLYLKTLRNGLLDKSQWAVLPGTPLTVACQEAFASYRQALHRLTLDFANLEDVVWPEEPILEYGDPHANA